MAIFPLFMGLLGGLALFLYGMELLADGLKAVSGERMRRILARLTNRRLAGAGAGMVVTAVIQSSSVTTVLLVGLISAGLMSLEQAAGVILGANLGGTVTAQLIAFHVTDYALLMVAVGWATAFFGGRRRWKEGGRALLGLGLVFLGMDLMGDAMLPLRDSPAFLHGMSTLESPAIGILAGTLFTALVQSSAATTGVVIVMAGQGLLPLEAGIALVLGANIGTCVTALLASIGRSREARRAALLHILFKVVGVALWLPFLEPFAAAVRALPGDLGREIANAHSLFNGVNTLLFLPLTGLFTRLVVRLLPDRPEARGEASRARYLDPDLLSTPGLALDHARLEILRIGDRVRGMLRDALPVVLDGDRESLRTLGERDDAVDALHGQVILYLGRISETRLGGEQTEELLKLLEAANSLESIGDVVETNLLALGESRIEDQVEVSAATREVLRGFHAAVLRALDSALLAVTQKNEEAARRVRGMKGEINRIADSAARHEARRLIAAEPNRLPSYSFETDLLADLKRIYYFCRRMARAGLPVEERVGDA